MTHRNLPALNKYTSVVQYEALKEINETNSCLILKDKSEGNRPEIASLKLEIERLEKEIDDSVKEANSIACFLESNDANSVLIKLDMAGYKKQRERNPYRNPYYDQYERCV